MLNTMIHNNTYFTYDTSNTYYGPIFTQILHRGSKHCHTYFFFLDCCASFTFDIRLPWKPGLPGSLSWIFPLENICMPCIVRSPLSPFAAHLYLHRVLNSIETTACTHTHKCTNTHTHKHKQWSEEKCVSGSVSQALRILNHFILFTVRTSSLEALLREEIKKKVHV